jgi:hypothetical protein
LGLSLLLVSCEVVVGEAVKSKVEKKKAEEKALKQSQSEKAFTGLKSKIDPRTKVKTEITYKEGERDGPSTAYHPNGQVWKSNSYKQNKLDGVAKIFDNKGKLKRAVNYSEGVYNGFYTEYFKSGNAKIVIDYNLGVPKLGYSSKNYKGEEKQKPKIIVEEKDYYYEGNTKQVEISFWMDPSPKGDLTFFLVKTNLNWDELTESERLECRLQSASTNQRSHGLLKLSLGNGEYSTIAGEVVAVYNLKPNLPVSVSHSIRLSHENL